MAEVSKLLMSFDEAKGPIAVICFLKTEK